MINWFEKKVFVISNSNIVLIGMPSSGKTTIGIQLAEKLGKGFIDTDLVIMDKEKRELKEIVSTDGLKRFLEIQEEAIVGLKLENYVVSTGGGAVYSEPSMLHLKQDGIIVYLETEYRDIEQRITGDRRFARSEGQSLLDLYNERVPLYRKYADITINCSNKSADDIVNEFCILYSYRGV